jgi:hypothetical protein
MTPINKGISTDDGGPAGPGARRVVRHAGRLLALTSGSNTPDQSSGAAVRKTLDRVTNVPHRSEVADMCASSLPIGDSAHPSIQQNAACFDCRPPFGRLGFYNFRRNSGDLRSGATMIAPQVVCDFF